MSREQQGARFTVHLAPSGFAVMDGQSAGVIESGYHARWRAQERCDELNALDRNWELCKPRVNVPADATRSQDPGENPCDYAG